MPEIAGVGRNGTRSLRRPTIGISALQFVQEPSSVGGQKKEDTLSNELRLPNLGGKHPDVQEMVAKPILDRFAAI